VGKRWLGGGESDRLAWGDEPGGLNDSYLDYPSDGYPDGYGPDEYSSGPGRGGGPGERSEWE
jgi:hypothetical protein